MGNSSRQPTLTRFSFYSLAFLDSIWLCFLMVCEVFVSDSPTPHTIGRRARNVCIKLLRVCRVLPTLALAAAWIWIAWPEVLTEPVAQLGLDPSSFDVLPANFAKTFWYLPVFYLACRFVYGMTPRLRLTSAYQILQLAYFRRTHALFVHVLLRPSLLSRCCSAAGLPSSGLPLELSASCAITRCWWGSCGL